MAAGDCESDSSRVENIVSIFFSKCTHLILQSRYTNAVFQATLNDVSTTKNNKYWFNLVLRDHNDIVPPSLIKVSSVSSPVQLVVDIVLLHSTAALSSSSSSYVSNRRSNGKGGKVIERWVMKFERRNGKDYNTGRFKVTSNVNTFYKKCVLMLRSLCLMVKLLPAYKLFRHRQSSEFSIGHHISTFVEPFSRDEEAQMKKYLFNPVETSCGTLRLSVLYLSSLGDLTTELCYHLLPHLVIPDYFGRVLVEPVWRGPKINGKGKVTFGSMSSGNNGRSSITTEKKSRAEPQIPIFAVTDADSMGTLVGERSTTVSVKTQLSTAEADLSTSLCCSRPPLTAKTHSHAVRRSGSLDHLRCEVQHCLNPEELRDPFQPGLSENAVIGSMFSIFSEATPLQRTSALPPNKPDHMQAVSVNVPAPTRGSVKTTSDALRELQKHIELKKRIIQRTLNIISHSDASKSPVGQDSTPFSK